MLNNGYAQYCDCIVTAYLQMYIIAMPTDWHRLKAQYRTATRCRHFTSGIATSHLVTTLLISGAFRCQWMPHLSKLCTTKIQH